MDAPLIFEFGVEWIWIQLNGVDWIWGWKSAPWRPLVWANLEPAGGGVDFNPREISRTTQRIEKR